ncbi:MAG: TonB-dependent receptor [Verrucomicrobia bacterium]|nr:TonB-dependent receptor [Verrucomicrobiota bacterium]
MPPLLPLPEPVRRTGPRPRGWPGIRWLALGFAAGPLFAASEPAGAERLRDLAGMSLEQLTTLKVEVVYGASRHHQATTAAPASVTIVKRDDIQRFGHRTLAEVLNSVAGFYATNDRGYSFIGVRGVGRPGDFGSRILLLVDGQRMNDGIYDSAASDTDFPIDVDLIERVEVVRGPGSSLYGTNAFFSVINVITRRGRDIDGAELAGGFGSFDTWTGRATFGRRLAGGWDFLVSGTLLDSAGNRRLGFPEFVAEDSDGSRVGNGFARVSYRDFTFQAGWARREKDWPTAAYDTVPNSRHPRLSTEDAQTFASLRFERTLGDEWRTEARLSYDRYRYDGIYPYDYDGDPRTSVDVNRDLAVASAAGLDWTMSGVVAGGHRLTFGGEWRHEFELTQQNWDVETGFSYVDTHKTGNVVGVFGQDEWSLAPGLMVQVGARYDRNRNYGGTVSPRGAVVFERSADCTFKFVYGEAFRAPSAYEAYYPTTAGTPGGGLRAEATRTAELIWEQRYGPMARSRLSVYQSRVRHLIDLVTQTGGTREADWLADTYAFENRTAVRARGVELEAERRFTGGVRLLASYALAETRDTGTGQVLDNSPRHLGKLNLAFPVWRQQVLGGLELQAISSRRTPRGRTVPGTCLANFTLFSRTLAPGLEVSASVYNLWDRRYWHPVSVDFTYTGPVTGAFIPLEAIEQDGRTFRLKLQYRF